MKYQAFYMAHGGLYKKGCSIPFNAENNVQAIKLAKGKIRKKARGILYGEFPANANKFISTGIVLLTTILQGDTEIFSTNAKKKQL